MAFILTQKPTFKAPVKVFMPNDNGGHTESTFKATFRLIDIDELTSLRELKPAEVLRKVMVGFDELIDEDKNKVEFNEDNFSALLLIPQAVSAAYRSFQDNLIIAKEKN